MGYNLIISIKFNVNFKYIKLYILLKSTNYNL